jgi:hypothetical protein
VLNALSAAETKITHPTTFAGPQRGPFSLEATMKQSAIAAATITKEKRCPICQRQFVRSRRSNRFRQSGRPNEEHIYCSSGCRQKAYRRRVRADRAVTQDRAAGPIEPQNSAMPKVHSAVTRSENHIESIEEFRAKMRGVRPLFRTHDGEVVADVKWPGMYRIEWRDGRVSDMVNYTRAVDALRRASQ